MLFFFSFTDDNSRCKSTPPPPSLTQTSRSNRHLSIERKSFTEEDFHQRLQGQLSKDISNPSRSLSTTNEETTSSFSGWDDMPSSPLPSVKSNHRHIHRLQESIKSSPSSPPPPPPPTNDCYYPPRPCDLSFTVNMTTTEDENNNRTDTKSTVIVSPSSTVVTITSPSPLSTTSTVKPNVISPQSQQSISRYRPTPFNLAQRLIAETSESALSEMSVEHQWTQNIVYQSKHPQRTRLSSSYSNLHDVLQRNDSSK